MLQVPIKVQSFLANVPLFKELASEELNRIASNTLEVRAERGHVLFRRGDPALGFHIAVVNELAAPVDMPIRFKIPASCVMNSFFIPALAGQNYAMRSKETKLHAVINRPGEYAGFSANYSVAGFSDMRFDFLGMSAADFDRWVQKAKAAGTELSRDAYLKLEQPSAREPVRRYRAAAPDLFDAFVHRCVGQGKTCLRDTMAMDMHRASRSPSPRDSVALSPFGAEDFCTADSFGGNALLQITYPN